MVGQTPVNQFHVDRKKVRDNLLLTRKLRLVKGSEPRTQKAYANIAVAGSPPVGVIEMPFTGNLHLTVAGGPGTVTINNPFVSGVGFSPIVLTRQPGTGATVAATAPGRIVLNSTADGVYIISVGSPISLPPLSTG